MTPYVKEMRGLPLWLLREYLVEIGGEVGPNGDIHGDGWTASLAQMDDFKLGSLVVGQVRLEVTADEQALARLMPVLEKKLLRAGG